ncbi:uncharacterized protein LOC101849955 [Aplysia californica]|uniref:Uncharacterized protein LOC101849955 n=1 Tax=Aplysia californica TaxID=6500 RepID=A0ABM1VZW1_APLCA|nr:uncharacterized protein LOC101849955 [Aplysia californica]
MCKIPKWLLQKEWLTRSDLVKLAETSGSSLEAVLAIDHSIDLQHTYRFRCTFCPRLCDREVKEYRKEDLARQTMRAHLLDHIKNFAATVPQEDQEDFLTRNQMWREKKTGSKAPASKNETSAKLARGAKRQSIDGGSTSSETAGSASPQESKKPKRQVKRSTKSAPKLNGRPQPLEDAESRDDEEESDDEEYVETVSARAAKKRKATRQKTSLKKVGGKKCKVEAALMETHEEEEEEEELSVSENSKDLNWSPDESSNEASTATQTETRGKKKEPSLPPTFQYKVATMLFATKCSEFSELEKTLDGVLKKEGVKKQFPGETLSHEDRVNILGGMAQLMEACAINEQEVAARLKQLTPLTEQERTTLSSLTPEQWKTLRNGKDLESQTRLKVSYIFWDKSQGRIRLWKCTRCEASGVQEKDLTFTRKHSLQYHILNEIGIPRYRCPEPGCPKMHNHTHHGQSHVRQHTGEKKYKCQVDDCAAAFTNRNTYSRHLLNIHNYVLQRNNEMIQISPESAQEKIREAQSKAKTRNKIKRQMGSNVAMNSVEMKQEGRSDSSDSCVSQVPSTGEPTRQEDSSDSCVSQVPSTGEPTRQEDSSDSSVSQVPGDEPMIKERHPAQVSTDNPGTSKLFHVFQKYEKEVLQKNEKAPPRPYKHPTTEHPSTEHPTTEHLSTEHLSTEHPTTEHPSTEHPTTEHLSTEHPTTEHPPTGHLTTGHLTTEHLSTEHPTTEHPPTEHPSTEHPPTEHLTAAPKHLKVSYKENKEMQCADAGPCFEPNCTQRGVEETEGDKTVFQPPVTEAKVLVARPDNIQSSHGTSQGTSATRVSDLYSTHSALMVPAPESTYVYDSSPSQLQCKFVDFRHKTAETPPRESQKVLAVLASLVLVPNLMV